MSLPIPEEEDDDRLGSSFVVDHKRRGALEGRVLISFKAVGDIDDEGVDEGFCFIEEGGEADDDDDDDDDEGNAKAESLTRCSFTKDDDDDD